MKYAILDENRVIVNLIEVEPADAAAFDAHYVGDYACEIGEQYPESDLKPPMPPSETEKLQAKLDYIAIMTGVPDYEFS